MSVKGLAYEEHITKLCMYKYIHIKLLTIAPSNRKIYIPDEREVWLPEQKLAVYW